MSRIIQMSATVIKQPETLKKAIEFMNELKNYGVVEARYQTDSNGRITSGYFTLKAEHENYGRGTVMLRYEGKGQPVYDVEGVLQSGQFRLFGDEDFKENRRLANLITDHYGAQVAKAEYERMGYQVDLSVSADGEEVVLVGTEGELATSSY